MAAAVATTVGLAVVGVGSPASSAPSDECPAAFPVDDLTAGQPVDGLTVSSGIAPDPFTGEVIGVLEDGIMPGLDMILTRLTSPEVDRVGIWQGMSGSPVYAADGRLIGAVAYGLALGPSTVAGVTPAADMQALLATPPSLRPRAGKAAGKVAIPKRLASQLVQDRVATRSEVAGGLSQLHLPFGLSGLSGKRVRQVSKKLDLDLDGMRMGAAGASSLVPPGGVVAGGNVAAAISYGDVTSAGVGTITAVCGDEVLAFGHPMLWSGPTTLSMHAASALYIQEDPTLAGFKLANVDRSPIGTIGEDRMAGIKGDLGAGPATGDVTSTVSLGARSRTGETKVAVRDWLPDVGFFHILSNEDRIFDGIGKGGADFGWTISGTREDGSPFSISRDDVFASEFDITFESAWDVLMALYTLHYNDIEDITIDDVQVDADLTRTYDAYTFTKAEIRQGGAWVQLKRKNRVALRPGKKAKFRVTVESPTSGVLRSVQKVRVPRAVAGHRGSLRIQGGNSFYDEEDFFFGGGSGPAKTFDKVMATIADAPRNDDVVVRLNFHDFRGRTVKEIERRKAVGLVVDGGRNFRVKVVR